MSNLVPEKRADRNGRVVTRHVKTGSSAPGTGRIPHPQIATRDDAEDQRLVRLVSHKKPEEFAAAVKAAPPELVKTLLHFYDYANHRHISRELADHTVKIMESVRYTRQSKRYAENLITHFDFMRTLECGDSTGIMLINGLIDAEDRIAGPLSERQQQAVMRVTKAMARDNRQVDRWEDYELRLRHGLEHLALTDSELVQMVADRPEDDEGIAAAVAAGTIGAGQIKAALEDGIQQPLLGGVL